MSFKAEDMEEKEEARDVRALVRDLPLFRDLDPALLDELVETIEWFAVPGGTTLFEDGDMPDALYFVINGSLGAYQTTPDGHRRLVGRVASGETVGEMALISGKPRSATVIALRDTELARLPRDAFERLMLSHPQGLLRISQLMVHRLDSSQRQTRGALRTRPKTIAIVPNEVSAEAAEFAAALTRELALLGRTELVLSQRGAAHTSQWFHTIERTNEFVIYVCDVQPTSWSKLCLRQSDAVLLLADADSHAAHWPVIVTGVRPLQLRRTELVLLHRGQIIAGSTARWLERLPGVIHHHVRHDRDVARVARLLSGRGLGLVLSGGGARGFAHIGVLRALREANITVDAIGGTSIGAIIAAGYALEWDDAELARRLRRCFVDTNPLNDYTVPFVALVSGRKVTRLLRREFESIAIEDVPLPFYCVSSNLTSGQLAVHRRGELWRWLRASVAIPGVLPPVVHQGELFVDGASINNLPIEVMREAGLGTVIGVDVGADRAFTTDAGVDSDAPPLWRIYSWFRSRKQPVNILQILWRAGTINSAGQRTAKHDLADLLLQPPLEQIDLLNWKGFDRAIAAGYEYARQRLAEWEREQRME